MASIDSMLSFISGGTGFVGRRLVNALQKKQIDVRLLSRSKQNEDTIICNLKVECIPSDALIGVDTVFHLAGIAHDVRDTSKISDLYYKVNVDATVQLAELAVKAGVKGLYL